MVAVGDRVDNLDVALKGDDDQPANRSVGGCRRYGMSTQHPAHEQAQGWIQPRVAQVSQ